MDDGDGEEDQGGEVGEVGEGEGGGEVKLN